jgi:hypothetical protein
MADPISALFASLVAAAGPAATAAGTTAGTTAAMAAPSILGGGMTGAGMMTAGAPIVPGLLVSSTPSMLGSLGAMGSAGLDYAKKNPALGLGIYDRMNQETPPPQAQPSQVSPGKGSIQYEPLLTTQVPRRRYPLSLLG